MSDQTKYCTSVKGLVAEAEATIASYDPADITDEDGSLCVIVDTITSMYDFTDSEVIRGIERLGGDHGDCCEDCREAGELNEDCEWLTETLESVADAGAESLNALLPEGTRGRFYFSWHDGAYVLMYGIDAEALEAGS